MSPTSVTNIDVADIEFLKFILAQTFFSKSIPEIFYQKFHPIYRCNRSCTWTIWNISTTWFCRAKLSRKLDQYRSKNWLLTSLTLSKAGLFIYLSLTQVGSYLNTCKIPPIHDRRYLYLFKKSEFRKKLYQKFNAM